MMERVNISKIESSKLNPRKIFDDEKLSELAESIKQVGVLEPILIRPIDDHYEVVVGERRFRASKMAGLREIPSIIKRMSDAEVREAMLVENVQRGDLSDLELGEMFKQLHDDYKLSFEAIGKKIGKGYDFVEARYHMFMKLSPVVKTLLTEIRSTENGMNYSKARELVSLPKSDQEVMAQKIEQFKLTSEQVKTRIKQAKEVQEAIENIPDDKIREELAETYLPKKFDPTALPQLRVDIYKKSGVWVETSKFEARLYPILESLRAFNEAFPDKSKIKEWTDAKNLKHFQFEVWLEI